jgi:hypothetical protein
VQLLTTFPLVDEILAPFSATIGRDFAGYRNHIYRVLNFFHFLAQPARDIPDSVLIAAAFHDIGIWTDGTFDYLQPSANRAGTYLELHGLVHLQAEVAVLIHEHHKLRSCRGEFAHLAEIYRRADYVDVSCGLLLKLTARQFLRTPLRPLPMCHF